MPGQLLDSADGRAADCGVEPVVTIEVEPAGKFVAAFLFGPINAGVGPLLSECAVEAFDLAVGLGRQGVSVSARCRVRCRRFAKPGHGRRSRCRTARSQRSRRGPRARPLPCGAPRSRCRRFHRSRSRHRRRESRHHGAQELHSRARLVVSSSWWACGGALVLVALLSFNELVTTADGGCVRI